MYIGANGKTRSIFAEEGIVQHVSVPGGGGGGKKLKCRPISTFIYIPSACLISIAARWATAYT